MRGSRPLRASRLRSASTLGRSRFGLVPNARYASRHDTMCGSSSAGGLASSAARPASTSGHAERPSTPTALIAAIRNPGNAAHTSSVTYSLVTRLMVTGSSARWRIHLRSRQHHKTGWAG
jgi:hypothetical protein